MAQSKPKGKKSFTPEQKEAYKAQKEAQKEDLKLLYEQFLAKKTIQDFIGIISNYKQTHHYSLRNYCMVLAQSEKRGDSTFVGVLNSFINWKKQDIQILRGSKGYKILVPIFGKRNNEGNKKEGDNTDKEDEQYLRFFKIGNIFDISQTSEYERYLKEQKEIDEKIMKNHEIDYETAIKFVKQKFPQVKITEDFKPQSKKGSYDPLSKEIMIYQNSSHTVFHEVGHHITISILKIAGDIRKDYAKNEVLAELTSYLLFHKFDENVHYNFAYSNVWANRITGVFEIEEFEHIFKTISRFIDKIK